MLQILRYTIAFMIYVIFRRFFLFAMLFLITCKTWANDYKIILWFNNGNNIEFFLNDYPLFVYEDDSLILQSNQSELSWPFIQLDKLTIENGIGTDSQKSPSENLNVIFESSDVYDLNGKMIIKQAKLPLDLPRGIFIVKKGNLTTKVRIK